MSIDMSRRSAIRAIRAIAAVAHRAGFSFLALDMSLCGQLRQPLVIIVRVQPCSLGRLVRLDLRQDLFDVRVRGEFILDWSH